MSTASRTTWQFKPLDPSLDRTEIDPGPLKLSRQQILRLYRAMRLARVFETRLAALYRQGRIAGAVYLGRGQEAIAAGVVSLLDKDDLFSTVARNLAGWLAKRSRWERS